MKTDLVKRVESLESKQVPAVVAAVFTIYVSPGHIGRPVKGWAFGEWNNRIQVLRLEGENDETLRRRAVALARGHIDEGNVPSLTSID